MDLPTDAPTAAWRAHLRRGLGLAAAGDCAGATASFEAAYAAAPDRPEVACTLGRERRRAGRLDEAERLLARALAASPGFTTAAAELARCLGHGGRRSDQAHAVLDGALAAGAAIGPLEVVRAELWLEIDRPDLARAAAMVALASQGGESVELAARAALARVENDEGMRSIAAGELDGALFAFKRAADLDPDWGAPLVNQGLAFERLARPERARRSYQEALARDPANERAHLNLGLLHDRRGEGATARAALEAAVRAAPTWPPARCALARHLRAGGELSDALALLIEGSERAPDEVELWLELATALGSADEPERAEAALRRALELEPTHVDAHLQLAHLLVRDGRYLEAGQLAAAARDLDPARTRAFLDRRARHDRLGSEPR